MRTIARNHKNKIAAARALVVKAVLKDLGTNFEGVDVDIDAAFAAHQDPNAHGAKLYDNEDGTYTIHIHSNRWFKLYTQDALDRLAAEQVKREARSAAELAQRTEAARTTRLGGHRVDITAVAERGRDLVAQRREQRNAATLARTTSIHDLGKPAVTVTRTRLAVNTQVKEACAALGIQADYFVSATASGYTVPGHGDFTLGQLADLVLVGGFDAAFGANETRPVEVNPFAGALAPALDGVIEPDEDHHAEGDAVVRVVDGEPGTVTWVGTGDDMTVRMADGTRSGGPHAAFAPAPQRTTVAEVAATALFTDDHIDLDAAMADLDEVLSEFTSADEDEDDGPSASDLDRLRALNLADRVAPVWKVANNGTGARIWFVLRRTPGGAVPAEYHEDVNGNIIRYTLSGALDVAERLNAASGGPVAVTVPADLDLIAETAEALSAPARVLGDSTPGVDHLIGVKVTLPHADDRQRGDRLDGNTATGFVAGAVGRHWSGRVVLTLASGVTVLATDDLIAALA